MTLISQRGEIALALAQFLGVRGMLAPEVEEVFSPVLNAMNVFESPYTRFPIACGEHDTVAAGGVGTFNYLVARPGATNILQVLKIWAVNAGATPLTITVRRMTPANMAAVDTALSVVMMADYGEPDPATDFVRSCNIFTGRDASATLGRGLQTLVIPATDVREWELPWPGIFIRGLGEGTTQAAQGGLGVVNSTANEALSAGFFCREWFLP